MFKKPLETLFRLPPPAIPNPSPLTLLPVSPAASPSRSCSEPPPSLPLCALSLPAAASPPLLPLRSPPLPLPGGAPPALRRRRPLPVGGRGGGLGEIRDSLAVREPRGPSPRPPPCPTSASTAPAFVRPSARCSRPSAAHASKPASAVSTRSRSRSCLGSTYSPRRPSSGQAPPSCGSYPSAPQRSASGRPSRPCAVPCSRRRRLLVAAARGPAHPRLPFHDRRHPPVAPQEARHARRWEERGGVPCLACGSRGGWRGGAVAGVQEPRRPAREAPRGASQG